jgi:hypothetical protein
MPIPRTPDTTSFSLSICNKISYTAVFSLSSLLFLFAYFSDSSGPTELYRGLPEWGKLSPFIFPPLLRLAIFSSSPFASPSRPLGTPIIVLPSRPLSLPIGPLASRMAPLHSPHLKTRANIPLPAEIQIPINSAHKQPTTNRIPQNQTLPSIIPYPNGAPFQIPIGTGNIFATT